MKEPGNWKPEAEVPGPEGWAFSDSTTPKTMVDQETVIVLVEPAGWEEPEEQEDHGRVKEGWPVAPDKTIKAMMQGSERGRVKKKK